MNEADNRSDNNLLNSLNQGDQAQDEIQQQLDTLEHRITDLLTILERIMQENHQLKAERIHHLKKNKRIQTQVEGMINRLKAMEKNNGSS